MSGTADSTGPRDPDRPPPDDPYQGASRPSAAPPPGSYGDAGASAPPPSGTYQEPYAPPPGRPARPTNGVAIAALVIGLLSVPLGLFAVGGIMGLVAVVLGIVGVSRARALGGSGQGMAITGIVSGVLAIVLAILVVAGLARLGNYLETEEGQERLSELEEQVREAEEGG